MKVTIHAEDAKDLPRFELMQFHGEVIESGERCAIYSTESDVYVVNDLKNRKVAVTHYNLLDDPGVLRMVRLLA